MELPLQEKFTLEEVAQQLGRSTNYVEDLVCARKFKYIIVKGEVIGGLPLTRHIYFDQNLWIEDYGEKVLFDPATRKQEYEAEVKLHQAHWEKEYGEAAKLYQAKFGEEIKFNPANLKKWYEQNVCETHYKIGPTEVAYLCQPSPISEQWNRPEGGTPYITRVALEDFQKRHGGKAEKKQAWDPSRIKPEEWYRSSDAASYLGMKQKSFQNRLIKDKDFRKMLGARKKRNRTWEFKGQAIMDYITCP